MADLDFPHGRRYYTKSGYFPYLDDNTIDRLMNAVTTIPSSETILSLPILVARRPRSLRDETAFGDRSAPFVLTLWRTGQMRPPTPATLRGHATSSINFDRP